MLDPLQEMFRSANKQQKKQQKKKKKIDSPIKFFSPHGNCDTICIHQKIQGLQYAGFKKNTMQVITNLVC